MNSFKAPTRFGINLFMIKEFGEFSQQRYILKELQNILLLVIIILIVEE